MKRMIMSSCRERVKRSPTPIAPQAAIATMRKQIFSSVMMRRTVIRLISPPVTKAWPQTASSMLELFQSNLMRTHPINSWRTLSRIMPSRRRPRRASHREPSRWTRSRLWHFLRRSRRRNRRLRARSSTTFWTSTSEELGSILMLIMISLSMPSTCPPSRSTCSVTRVSILIPSTEMQRAAKIKGDEQR